MIAKRSDNVKRPFAEGLDPAAPPPPVRQAPSLMAFRAQYPGFEPYRIVFTRCGTEVELTSWPYEDDERDDAHVFVKGRLVAFRNARVTVSDPTTLASYRVSGPNPELTVEKPAPPVEDSRRPIARGIMFPVGTPAHEIDRVMLGQLDRLADLWESEG